MIIECDQCNTKFRLDDTRINPNGVKVRCTKCQNVFIVTPPPPPEEVLVEEVFGPDTPFMEKGRKGADYAGAGGPQDKEGAEQESASWGVFNSGDEGDGKTQENAQGPGDKHFGAEGDIKEQETGDEGQDMDDGRGEPPELSFGGPDFSSLSGLSDKGPASGEETADAGRKLADGPWFTGAVGEDDGFPEDGLADGPVSGETPFADELAPSAEAPVEEGFDVSAPLEDAEEGEKPPFDEFDFGLDDEQDDAEKGAQAHTPDAWGARENDAADDSADNTDEDAIEDAGDEPETYDEFSLTPPPEPPARQSESVAGEKVIPFSTGYNRSGKSPKTGADQENRFEDLFTRTLSEKDAEGTGEAGEAEDLEFDKDEFPLESPAAPEQAPAPQHYAAGRGVMLAVLIFILGAGAIYFSGIIDTIARTLTGPDRTEVVEIETISGYMAENKNFGRFFVIEAKIENTSDEAQTIDRITGIIYDGRGRSIATRSVSPGRVVTGDDLKNLTKAELLGRFSDSSGGVIPPKGTVPVMVPFTEIPADMAEYGLKIIRE